jgi:hypothetical protein
MLARCGARKASHGMARGEKRRSEREADSSRAFGMTVGQLVLQKRRQCGSRCFLTPMRNEGIRVAKTGVSLKKHVHARIEVRYAGSAASVQSAGNCPVGGRCVPGG